MPAPRACRACGAQLPPDVRRCPRCASPVVEFAPRRFRSAPATVPGPPPQSRWRAGPTSFGPAGRLVITALVAVVIPIGVGVALFEAAWPFALWFLAGWGVFAGTVLRQTWQPTEIAQDEPAAGSPVLRIRERTRLRYPRLGRPLPTWCLALVVGSFAGTIAIVAWAQAGIALRFFAVAFALAALLGLFLGSWNQM